MSDWAKETPEKVNYTKLCRLLYDGGSKAARSVLDGKIPASSLAAELNKSKSKLQNLKKPIGKVLSPNQWDKLYPPSGAIPKSEDFDITLLFVLLRNICGLKKPSTGWDALPPPTDTTLEADLVRIKYYRNEVIAHSSSAEIDDVKFENYWKKISFALVSLGLKQDVIDDFKSSIIGTDDFNKLVYDWYLSDKEIKTQLEELKTELKSSAANIELGIADLKAIWLPPSTSLCIDKLICHDFSNLISLLNNFYHPNTRQWILNEVESHVKSTQPNPVIVIQAPPGMGKSVVAGKICKIYKEQGFLGGCHFFQHSNSQRNNPRLMFQSIARQLCDSVPEYQAALEKKLQPREGNLSDLGCEELFTVLFDEPCCNITSDKNVLVVIDALDECCNALKKEFFRVITNGFPNLPSWLRLVITTRPPPNVSAIERFPVITISPVDERNENDLQCFFCDNLRELGYEPVNETGLVKLTEGLFLVAYFVIDFLKAKNPNTSLKEALEHFPREKGITSVYDDYFLRIRTALVPHLNDEEGFFRMLDAVVAAKSPIEIKIFYKILGLGEESRVPNPERKEAIHLLHQLFPVENDHVSVFHKTVLDWLTFGDHDFKVKGDGSGILANACYDVLSDIRQGLKEKDKPLTLTDSEVYALDFELDYKDQEKKLVTQINHNEFCLKALYYSKRFCDYNIGNSFSQFNVTCPFEQSLSDKLRDIYCEVRNSYIHYHRNHKSSCQFHDLPNFGQCLEFVLQAVNLLKVDQCLENPLALLREAGYPYLERETLHTEISTDPDSMKFLVANDRFFLVKYLDQGTLAQEYQFDGTLVKEERFQGKKNMLLSPGNAFLVVTAVRAKDNIDIFDATSLQKYTSFKPPNVIRSCHVFGNSQSWYIVTRCFNNKIYILKGETGEVVGDPTVVQQNDEILDVSHVGHILLKRPHTSLHERNFELHFTDEDENICDQMVWIVMGIAGGISFKETQELFLCDHKNLDKKIPIFVRQPQVHVCKCEQLQGVSDQSLKYLTNFSQPVCFSDDGDLLALSYGGIITIVNTTDGSLYKCFSTLLYPVYNIKNILFVSRERVALQDNRKIFLFKIGIGMGVTTLEHMFFLQPETKVCRISSTISQLDMSPSSIERRKMMNQESMRTLLYVKRVEERSPFSRILNYSGHIPPMHCYLEKYELHNLLWD